MVCFCLIKHIYSTSTVLVIRPMKHDLLQFLIKKILPLFFPLTNLETSDHD